jgi:divalent metal cation (Fe/Co/Zn/Cd) transporter
LGGEELLFAGVACGLTFVTSDRSDLLASALRLSFFTIAWNGAVGAAALAVSVADGSLALASFGLSALLDTSASGVLVWRFMREQRDPVAAEHLERRAQSWIALAMLTVGAYAGVQGVRALLDGSHSEASAFGVILAAVSVLVLPWLGWRKVSVAARLASQALRGDGVITAAAAVLAATTLAALLVNSTLGWWWADPAAALLIAAALMVEGARIAVRHRFG